MLEPSQCETHVALVQDEAAPSSATGGFRPYKGNTNTNTAMSSEMKATMEGAFPEVILNLIHARVCLL